MENSDEKQDEELLPANWECIMVDDYDWLYKLLHAEYKEFEKRHRSSKCTIQGLEGEIKGLHSCIQQLEDEIEDLILEENMFLEALKCLLSCVMEEYRNVKITIPHSPIIQGRGHFNVSKNRVFS